MVIPPGNTDLAESVSEKFVWRTGNFSLLLAFWALENGRYHGMFPNGRSALETPIKLESYLGSVHVLLSYWFY